MASYSSTLPTTTRYKAEYGEPFAPLYGRSRKRHQYVLLPGNAARRLTTFNFRASSAWVSTDYFRA
ncbi:hypothetical protein DPMN_141433 [Dreissena polymorpha]|uniref:Uncharacterized protein n=1 Tax=Dreissena polymorpha TaxID=45954 RepID=A0A9D4JL94_DREPO|nr:hypothetical protein DPMN_141433 [Dreissena polymorpha]